MKRINELQKEIQSILDDIDSVKSATSRETAAKDKREIKKLFKRITYLKTIILYLETNPSEETIKEQKSKLKTLIDNLTDEYNHYFVINGSPGNDKKIRETYFKMHNMKKLKQQLSNLRFIMS